MSIRKFCSCLKDNQPKCDHPWAYDFAVDGIRYRQSTKTPSVLVARRVARKKRNDIVSANYDLDARPTERLTFEQLWKRYQEGYVLLRHRPSTRGRDLRAWAPIRAVLGKMRIDQITSEHLGR